MNLTKDNIFYMINQIALSNNGKINIDIIDYLCDFNEIDSTELVDYFNYNDIEVISDEFQSAFKNVDRLSKNDEYSLIVKAKSGDKDSVEILLRQYKSLLVNIVGKYFRLYGSKSSVFDYDDFFSEAYIEFISTINHFKIDTRCLDFCVCLAINIRRSLNRNIITKTIPLNMCDTIRIKLFKIISWASDHDIELQYITLEQICDICNCSLRSAKEYHFILNLNFDSFDADDTIEYLRDYSTCTDDAAINNIYAGVIDDIVESLPQMERSIIKCRFGFDDNISHSVRQVAEILNISVYDVNKSLNNCLDFIRYKLSSSNYIS